MNSITMIDFEASSLAGNSHPIEVGIAKWRPGSGLVRQWSTLVAPEPDWTDWSPESAAIHKIPIEALHGAPSAREVASEMNAQLDGHEVHCDGGAFDVMWATRLNSVLSTPRRYVLRNWFELLAHFNADQVENIVRRSRENPHRAGPDAALLVTLIAETYGETPKTKICRTLADAVA